MKTDRLLEITLYLIRYKSATARQMADYFGVSVRTIQRDIDSLSVAGIPITANTGRAGGYRIAEEYRLENSFVQKEDFRFIIMALKSLQSSYSNARLDEILNRYLAEGAEPNIYLDYSVTCESPAVQGNNALLEQAIHSRRQVRFCYQANSGSETRRCVQPYALRFKWYDWYLFCFDVEKQATRTFKVARMRDVSIQSTSFTMPADCSALLAKSEAEYLQGCEAITVFVRESALVRAQEYFPIAAFEPAHGGYTMRLCVPPAERLWQALLLSMGADVKILSPASYAAALLQTARDFLQNYDRELS